MALNHSNLGILIREALKELERDDPTFQSRLRLEVDKIKRICTIEELSKQTDLQGLIVAYVAFFGFNHKV